MRLGRTPESLIGQPVEEVVAPGDQPTLRAVVAMVASRGRLEPTTTRLAEAKATPFVISGLYLDLSGHAPRVCLSLAPPPVPLKPVSELPGPGAQLRAAEGRLRRAAAGGPPGPDRLGLIESRGEVPAAQQHQQVAGRPGRLPRGRDVSGPLQRYARRRRHPA